MIRIALPLLIDVLERRVVWCDNGSAEPGCLCNNNFATSKGGIRLTLQSLVQLTNPNLHDLFLLHVRARGERGEAPEEAERVFYPENGTPFRQDEITPEYL